MKNLAKIFTLFIIVSVFGLPLNSCKEATDIFNLRKNKKKDIPMKLEFYSIGGPVEGNTSCGEPPIVLIRQEGEGQGTLLGDFEFFSQFCNNLATGEFFGGPEATGYFTAANGDRLNVTGDGVGQIVPSDNPDYDLMFSNPIIILGGTGRFEGASGNLVTQGYVKLAENRTDHVWRGTITLAK